MLLGSSLLFKAKEELEYNAVSSLITLLTNISVHSQKGQKSAENDPLHLQRRRGSCHQEDSRD